MLTGSMALQSAKLLPAIQNACCKQVAQKAGRGVPGHNDPRQVQKVRRLIDACLARLLKEAGLFPSAVAVEIMAAEILDDLFYAGPITYLLQNDRVQEILINGPDKVFVVGKDETKASPVTFRDEAHLLQTLENLAASSGRPLEKSPFVRRQLPDGTLLSIVMPPLSADGIAATIVKPALQPFDIDDLVTLGTLSPPMALFLQAGVQAGLNVMVAGKPGSGRTTLLSVLAALARPQERFVLVEETARLFLHRENVVRLRWRPGAKGNGASQYFPQLRPASPQEAAGDDCRSARGAVEKALSMRPQRLLVDDVQGSEAYSLLQAMHDGSKGTMFSIYGRSSLDALERLKTKALAGAKDLSPAVIGRQVAAGVELVVHLDRLRDGSRKITRLGEIVPDAAGLPGLRDLFLFDGRGIGPAGRVAGCHRATGLIPKLLPRIQAAGLVVPTEIFQVDP